MKDVIVYKSTQDNWCPSYHCHGLALQLVCIGFFNLDNGLWRVSAYGDDDCGLEKDFQEDQFDSAWCLFLFIIGLEFVNMKDLLNLGFKSA